MDGMFRSPGAIAAITTELGRNYGTTDDNANDDRSKGSTGLARKFFPISLATLGVVLGVGAMLSAMHVNSVHVGIWGFTSGAFAAFCLHLAVLDRMGVVENWYTPTMLGNIVKLGFVVQLCGLIGTIVYIVLTVTEHHESRHGHTGLRVGFYLTAVGSILTFAWGFYLSLFAWKLKLALERKQASLLGGVRPYPEA